MMITVIYDSTAKPGHNSEYIRHLIVYIKTSKLTTKETYVFILHPTIIKRIGEESLTSIEADSISIVPISEDVCSKVAIPDQMYSRYKNSFVEAHYINTQLLFFKAERLILMFIDAELFTIKRISSPFLVEITGIYLRPLPAIPYTTDLLIKRANQSLKRAIKILLIKYFLDAQKLKFVFILDDNGLVTYLQKIIRTTKFISLPDPFIRPVSTGRYDPGLLHSLGVKQAYFLAFGVMEPRKNLLNIIKAFDAFTWSSTTPAIGLLIVGKFVSADYKREVVELIDKTFLNRNVSVIVHDRFIDDTERDLVFAESKAVLMPYLNFQCSSGLLGHAVMHNKPAIVGSLGLVGDLVSTYKLGISVNPNDVNQIRLAMQQALTFRLNRKLRDLFLQTRTPNTFASILLDY